MITKRGGGYWKLNTSLLENKEYKEQISEIIKNISNTHETFKQKWEILKDEVKKFSIIFSVKQSNRFKKKIFNIEKEIEYIESLPYNEIDMIRKRNLETQLNEFYDKKSKGAQIRSRAKWINEGEKNTKYFLCLENKHQT